jgi:ribosomal protein L19E
METINPLLIDWWVIEDIREEIKKYMESNENENTTYQNLWNTAKAVFRREFVTMNAYIKKIEKFQINDIILRINETKS